MRHLSSQNALITHNHSIQGFGCSTGLVTTGQAAITALGVRNRTSRNAAWEASPQCLSQQCSMDVAVNFAHVFVTIVGQTGRPARHYAARHVSRAVPDSAAVPT